ncbi:MAG: ribosomal RNA small subunit methyltransferase A [Bdellovibrio sp.]|nr:MAG: ribosomal RNA small subunit methyltransferase A [Bdellovibrio sp.]
MGFGPPAQRITRGFLMKQTARAQLVQVMKELRLEARKSLGQNFLVSDSAIERILRAAARFQPRSLVEVGPGLGALTVGLSELCERLVLLELDARLAEYWRSRSFEVVEVDALAWSWRLNSLARPCVLASNLPYQISSSLVVDRSLDPLPLDGMVLMFQKEVAQRIRARSGQSNYGFLSVLAQTFWDIETLLEAGPGDFYPSPKVASRVLVFTPRQPGIADPSSFLRFLKACFLHPRKLMASNLAASATSSRSQPGAQPHLRSFFIDEIVKMGLAEKVRAQQLELSQFVELFHRVGSTFAGESGSLRS